MNADSTSAGTKVVETIRVSTSNALKTVYYVIIGLAFTEALERSFIQDDVFIGLRIFSKERLSITLLLAAWVPTTIRFIHGSTLHLEAISRERYKPLLDFIGFFFQASLFYLMAISLVTTRVFVALFCFMLVFDSLWVIGLHLVKYIKLRKTERQWLLSNALLIVAMSVLYWCKASISDQFLAQVVCLGAVAASVWDYVANRDFYFPET